MMVVGGDAAQLGELLLSKQEAVSPSPGTPRTGCGGMGNIWEGQKVRLHTHPNQKENQLVSRKHKLVSTWDNNLSNYFSKLTFEVYMHM